MKKVILGAALCLIAVGCGSKSSNSPVLTAIDAAGCDVETAITSTIGSAVVTACKGTGTAAACGSAFQTALGNVNLCATPVPAASAVAVIQALVQGKVLTIGDITAGQLNAAKEKGGITAKAVKPMGLVGSIACPIAVNTTMGYLTAQIPLACGCTLSLTASQIDADITAACESAVPL